MLLSFSCTLLSDGHIPHEIASLSVGSRRSFSVHIFRSNVFDQMGRNGRCGKSSKCFLCWCRLSRARYRLSQRAWPVCDVQWQTAQAHTPCRIQPPVPCLRSQRKTGLTRAGTGLTLSFSCSHKRFGARGSRVWNGRSWRRKFFGTCIRWGQVGCWRPLLVWRRPGACYFSWQGYQMCICCAHIARLCRLCGRECRVAAHEGYGWSVSGPVSFVHITIREVRILVVVVIRKVGMSR